ncbi:MAG: PQQ-dependent sugar dehydrogenase [Bacteroidia bacterium]|nr:MAG: PQQ-dependent sugar dehydrogenase [Bacteroidia bacterium]
MKRYAIAIIFSIFLLSIYSCNNKAAQKKTDAAITGSPVETKAANTDYKPAFNNQYRVGSVQTNTPYSVIEFAKGLENPWGIAALPDGRLIITQKNGTLKIVDQNGALSDAITGLPSVKNAGQGGLLGIAVDPDFSKNRTLFWVFSEAIEGGNVTAVAKGILSTDEKTIQNAQVIYRALPAYNGTLHYGGRIVIDKEGTLYVSTGERSDKITRPQAQELNSALGKIVRIHKDGTPVSSNPYFNTANAKKEIYSFGHRNTQGLTIQPQTGNLWNSEFGPRGGDEINLVQKGKNYGWPTITYGIEYSGGTIGDGITQKEGMEQPVYYWDPVISPSGITFYNNDAIPEWKDNLFLACLSGQHVARLVIKNNQVVGEERLMTDINKRCRDIVALKDGALYVITDGKNGSIYKISKK